MYIEKLFKRLPYYIIIIDEDSEIVSMSMGQLLAFRDIQIKDEMKISKYEKELQSILFMQR